MKINYFLLCFTLVLSSCASNGKTFEELIMTCRDSTYELNFLGISGSFKRSVDCSQEVIPEETVANAEAQQAP
jgi:hypothetical protein|tara:strand:+ start:151 stop:369 length:219 start_codon:yes stop_codon:yes gene_type:complete